MTAEKNKAPTISLKSMTFDAQDGDNIIHAEFSNWTGMETVTFNGEIVVEKRNLTSFSSNNVFEKNGHTYEVRFLTSMNEIECMIVKDDVIIYSEFLDFPRKTKPKWLYVLELILMGAGAYYLTSLALTHWF